MRFFTQKENIRAGEIIIDDAPDIHHITHVLRLKEGALFTVFDSDGWEYEVELLSASKKEARVKILDKMKNSREPDIRVTLFQGIPKQGKMENIIQKSVELGAGCIVPVVTSRVIGKPVGKTERWQKVAEEAVKQCRRAAIPPVTKEIAFSEMTDMLCSGTYDAAVFAYENEENRSLKDALRNFSEKPRSLAVVIGPEGGFSEAEARALAAAGAESVSLGKTILRTETAGPAAVAMVMYEMEM